MTKPRNTAAATNARPRRSMWRCSSCGTPRLERRARDFARGLALGLAFARDAGAFLRGLAAVGMVGSHRFDAGGLHPAQRRTTYAAPVSGYTRDPRVLVV